MLDKQALNVLSTAEKDELIFQQAVLIDKLEFRIKELEARLSKNSQNSSKPPSSDGYNKKPAPKSQRQKSGKKSGGQSGHTGSRLERVETPDFIVTHKVDKCCHGCGHSLEGTSKLVEVRQEFDLPPIKIQVTEHQIETCRCEDCGYVNKGKAPDHITQPVQYGARINAIAVYLGQYQLMPSKRICETFWDLLGVKISEGFIYKAYGRCHANLNEYEQSVKAMLQCAAVEHFDESGVRVKKELHWLHVASTDQVTYYAIHKKRGGEAMEAIGILPAFKGRAIHDHWKAYFMYDCDHGLCNAHHLRELTYQHEQYDQKWCEQMRSLLLRCNKEIQTAKGQQRLSLPEVIKAQFEMDYDNILAMGLTQIPTITPSEGMRGKKKRHPARNLMDRLLGFKEETLAFMHDFNIPFTNNQGEQDIRMIKVKQKISGCFRSKGGAQIFCRIRGYVSTARKQSHQIFEALIHAVNGSPFVPNTS